MTRTTSVRNAGGTFIVYSGAGWYNGITWFMWLPVLVFELTVAVWFLVKGVAMPAPRQA